MTMREWIEEFNVTIDSEGGEDGGLLLMDGFDDAIVGVARRGADYGVAYDFDRVIQQLLAEGLTLDEAFQEAHALVNMVVNGRAPIFLHMPPQEKADE